MTIAELLNAKEGENVEFKEAKNSYEFDNLAKYACAVSNLGGGRVVFGITDKRPRKVVGRQAFEQPERTRKGLIDRLHINVDFTELSDDAGHRVLVFIVPSRPIGQVVQNSKDGIAWWRIGDSLVPMPDEVRRQIYEEGGHDFSADICPGATLADLDKDAIANFRQRWFQRSARTSENRFSLSSTVYGNWSTCVIPSSTTRTSSSSCSSTPSTSGLAVKHS